MKVIIGPYFNYIGPYQIMDLLKYVGVSEDRRSDIAELLNKTFVGDFCRWVHKHRKVKKVIRIDKYDTWSMDYTLALIILPMLKQLKETKHSSAGNLEEFSMTSNISSQYCFDFYSDGDDAAWEAGHKKWDEILDKMIWSFEQIVDNDSDSKFWIDSKKNLNTPSYPSELCRKYDLLEGKEFDHVAYEKHHKRIEEGLELFGKHYNNLWD